MRNDGYNVGEEEDEEGGENGGDCPADRSRSWTPPAWMLQ